MALGRGQEQRQGQDSFTYSNNLVIYDAGRSRGPRNSTKERQETKQGPCLRAHRKQQQDRNEWYKVTEPGAARAPKAGEVSRLYGC